MCRIGSSKSKTPVEPSLALEFMTPRQEGHGNSGIALVMQDLAGMFAHYKTRPLLSLAATRLTVAASAPAAVAWMEY